MYQPAFAIYITLGPSYKPMNYTKLRTLAALTLLTCSLLPGCTEFSGTTLFLISSSNIRWEGFVAGIPFSEQGRFERSKRIQFRTVVRATQPEDNYLLTLEAASDGKDAHITVARGADFPSVTSAWPYFDFLEDMSDGKEHDFDLQKSSAKTVGTLKLRFIR